MNIIAIIPARMGSSRYPGKPLALIHNVPMVGHVAFRTAMSKTLSATYVATCDDIIENYCKGAGLDCVMTGDHHVRCSTRTAEALLKIEAATGKKADYNGTQIDVYEKQTVGKAITWDMRINWSMPTVREQEAYVTLSVDNVLNRSNAIELTGTDLVYEKGRQYWLEVGYRF